MYPKGGNRFFDADSFGIRPSEAMGTDGSIIRLFFRSEVRSVLTPEIRNRNFVNFDTPNVQNPFSYLLAIVAYVFSDRSIVPSIVWGNW